MTDKQQFCDTYVDLKKRVSRQKATNRKKLVAFALPNVSKEKRLQNKLSYSSSPAAF